MSASHAFMTVTEFLSAHPEIVSDFKADPGATMATHGYFLSEANIALINSIIEGTQLAPDSLVSEQQLAMLASL